MYVYMHLVRGTMHYACRGGGGVAIVWLPVGTSVLVLCTCSSSKYMYILIRGVYKVVYGVIIPPHWHMYICTYVYIERGTRMTQYEGELRKLFAFQPYSKQKDELVSRLTRMTHVHTCM